MRVRPPTAATKSKAVAKSRSFNDIGWLAFEEFGSYAGPPAQPECSEIGVSSLLLRWQAPQHLGGSGSEVIGYVISVQFAGDSGFKVHIENTESPTPQCVVNGLTPNMWHEFVVAAITTAGTGAPSPSSRPVLTEKAPVRKPASHSLARPDRYA